MTGNQIPLAEAFASRPDRFHLLEKGLRSAGWNSSKRTLLEIGCARGDAAAFLVSKYGYDVTAVELSAELTAEARHRYREVIADGFLRFCCSDAGDLPFSVDSFDGLYCEAAFSPMHQKIAAVEEFYRVLKNGGRVLMNDFAVHTDPGRELREELVHIPCFAGVRTMSCYQKIFEEKGFRTVSCHEEYGELIRIAKWLCRVYDVPVTEIGGYLSRFYGKEQNAQKVGSPNCESIQQSYFFKKSHLTYCQMIFEKPEI